MEGYNIEKEMREAIEAGENALYSLRAAKEELRKAGNWGIADLLGGGFFVSLIKHSMMEQARYDLKKFQKELRDVTVNTDLSLNCGDFLTFADFFWDGVVADWLVQSKINEARSQVEQAIPQVEQILSNLKRY